VQAGLGITHGAAFDLQAVCSGFVYALQVTDALFDRDTEKVDGLNGEARTLQQFLCAAQLEQVLRREIGFHHRLFGHVVGAVAIGARCSARSGHALTHSWHAWQRLTTNACLPPAPRL
jgi:3-oxoacyl-[acyl-carrier-protein] synthase III